MFCTLLKILHKIVKSCKGEWYSTKISVTMLKGASLCAKPQCQLYCASPHTTPRQANKKIVKGFIIKHNFPMLVGERDINSHSSRVTNMQPQIGCPLLQFICGQLHIVTSQDTQYKDVITRVTIKLNGYDVSIQLPGKRKQYTSYYHAPLTA